MSSEYDVIVVGAGAAGLCFAGFAGRRGLRVLVVEKNDRPAKKVLITGKGRCNVTNHCSEDAFIQAVKTNGRFLYSAIHAFGPQDTMALFESLGVPLKTERGNRVFPQSDRAGDIADALVWFAKGEGRATGQIHRAECQRLLLEEGRVRGIVCGRDGNRDEERFFAPAVVIATGGKSYPGTGSTGDGYRFALEAGHTVTEIRPSLVPLVTEEDCCRQMMGLSLKNVVFQVKEPGKKKPIFQEMGEMLFTHFGISGPLVLSASCHLRPEKLRSYQLSIDIKPALTEQQLDARILRDFEKFQNRDFANSLSELLPQKMIPVIVGRSGIWGETKVHQVTKEQRRKLVELLKHFPLTCKTFRPIEEAIVTSGGVKVGEIDPKTMESKLVKGLFFIGEVLDVDAYTGGFNLQAAFSTGYLAAQSVGVEETEG